MKRIDENSISITQHELDSIREFIRDALHREWDRHTNSFICSDTWEDGMRRMNHEMYDMAEKMSEI